MNVLTHCRDIVSFVKNSIENALPSPMSAKSKKRTFSAIEDQPTPSRSQKRPCIDPSLLPVELHCGLDAAAAAFSIFPVHTNSLLRLRDRLQKRSWHSIHSLPDEIRALQLNYPVLIPAEQCWRGGARRAPSADDIYRRCAKKPISRKDIIEFEGQHAKDKTLRDVLQQMRSPPVENPLVAHNIVIEGRHQLMASAIPFTHLRPSDADEEDHSMNVTPKNKVVDIHIDQGSCGLSIGLGRPSDDPKLQVHKIWFLWPPTEHNLQVFERLCKSKKTKGLCLARSQTLKHGVIAAAGPEAGILLPPGWLHGTVTTNSGFLGGITYTLPTQINMISRMFAMDMRISPEAFPHKVPLYCNALRQVCNSEDDGDSAQIAIDEWLQDVEPSLKSVGFKSHLKEHAWGCKQLTKEWKLYLGAKKRSNVASRVECRACGWRKSNEMTFGEHFWKTHLKVVTPTGCKSPYRRSKGKKGR